MLITVRVVCLETLRSCLCLLASVKYAVNQQNLSKTIATLPQHENLLTCVHSILLWKHTCAAQKSRSRSRRPHAASRKLFTRASIRSEKQPCTRQAHRAHSHSKRKTILISASVPAFHLQRKEKLFSKENICPTHPTTPLHLFTEQR